MLEKRLTAQVRATMKRITAWSVAFLVTCAAMFYFFQEPFLSYPGGTVFPMMEASVQRGHSITLLVPRRCNSSNKKQSFKLVRGLVRLDQLQTKVDVPSIESVIEANVCDTVRKSYRVPDDLPPGIYKIQGDVLIPGWFRTFYIRYTSTPFEVT